MFGLVFNQCCYTIGLSITSPINSSIVTTSMPIFAMLLSALILKEPITGKKAGGVFMGFSGALLLILTSATADNSKVGDLRGDLLCMFAQLSFAVYLSMFNKLRKRYSVFTVDKWTVVSVYNYVQPAVAVIVSVLSGLGVFKLTHALAVVLVFFGVRFVTKSRKRSDN